MKQMEQILLATAQAAIEAHIQLNKFPELYRYIFEVRTPSGGVTLQICHNHQVTVFVPENGHLE